MLVVLLDDKLVDTELKGVRVGGLLVGGVVGKSVEVVPFVIVELIAEVSSVGETLLAGDMTVEFASMVGEVSLVAEAEAS